MASCSTPQWSTSYTPQAKLTVVENSSTNTQVELSWKLEYVTYGYAASTNGSGRAYTVKIADETVKSGTFDINGKYTTTIATGTKTIDRASSDQNITFSVSFTFDITWSNVYGGTKSASGSITIGKKPVYTVTYNANGGSGAPSSQTKWSDTSIVLSSIEPTRSGYTFLGWSTTYNGNVLYYPGDEYSTNADITLYAIWNAIKYTIYYDANGGTGSPAAQTKKHGETITLSTITPTRTDYAFLGWGTSSSSTVVSYSAGATYSGNTDLWLYAVWDLKYKRPNIHSLSVDRCTESGTLIGENDAVETTSALVKFEWSTFNDVQSIYVDWKSETADVIETKEISASGTSGSVEVIIGNNAFSMDQTFVITVTVADYGGNSSKDITLPGMLFVIDLLAGGRGIAFGKPAELNGTMDVNFECKFRQPVEFESWVSFKSETANRILWNEGAWHMHSGQYANLSETISSQKQGIVLAWSAYDGTNVYDYDWYYMFVPKHHIIEHAETGVGSGLMINSSGFKMGHKYVYIYDSTIVGTDLNSKTVTVDNITFSNSYWVLRYVIGV
jgi:uncharacterized repeat protein (TIGR02543 family)